MADSDHENLYNKNYKLNSLTGIIVVDFGQYIAGPMVTKILT